MMVRLVGAVWIAVAGLVAASAGAADEGWQVVQGETAVAGADDVRETIWSTPRPPSGTYDRIRVHRFRTTTPGQAVLLYLPGTNMNGTLAITDERYNLWLYLARRGVEVFALDYRTHVVPATGVEDFGFMKPWTTEAFVGDAAAAAALALRESGGGSLFVAGFSRGVTLAYGLAASADEAAARRGLAGLVLLDGSFKNHAPRQVATREDAQARLERSGAWASDVAAGIGWENRHQLMQRTITDPDGPAYDADFANNRDHLAHVLYNAWRPGGLANPIDGISRPEVLAQLLDGYDRYYPAIQNADGAASADYDDDPETPVDDGWGELELPILYFGTTALGHTWLLNGIYSASAAGSHDVELHFLERYGHLDVLVGEEARTEVFEPTLRFILEHAAPPAG